MGFSYRKRVNLGKGAGINIGTSGLSGSYRSRLGSFGTTGFSLRSGIPGLSLRGSWKKGVPSVFGIIVLAAGIITVLYNIIRLVLYLGLMSVRFLRSFFQKNKSNS